MPVDDVIVGVYAILDARSHGVELHAGTPLGSGGLGLDSIALVEVLLESPAPTPSRRSCPAMRSTSSRS